MTIVKRMARGAVSMGATAAALLLGGVACAATVPSDLMRPDATQAAPGYVVHWTFSIELASTQVHDIERCRKILADGGLMPVLSTTASSATPVLHYRLLGRKEYAQADTAADELLAAVQLARCGDSLSWTVSSQVVPARP